ncbi:NAD-dependent epimerase/dehydratase family protein [Nocardioides mesophilus]|uniref:NAD-dependent epimerase/dehydratase family protein n=1 Tax=Nocardioides mesophilus TaxID=433659 RepID=A0A7G9RGY8_9ACTN|nr:NAD-dependent epimerase/dehydratase family protein [Nocardioides mesophilus]QNN54863.1 NAD-dependent epimerase/dehydratase family protein [Nocardioides mesophilus]
MRIVVTGASGNVGSAVLRRLVATRNHEITGVARRLPEGGEPFDQVDWVSVDLTRPAAAEQLRAAFRGADAVVHLAWGFQPSHDLDYLAELGVGGTRRVVEAVAAEHVPHLLHMSSVGAYSPKADDEPVDESWPTEGVPSSPYSRHKATAERLLDDFERSSPATVVTRMRPGIVGQGSAGSALLRYGVPAIVPARAIGLLPVLPLDRGLRVPMVHADDVAQFVDLALDARAHGAFNLAAEPDVTAADIAAVLGARLVHVPAAALRVLVAATWHARVQQVDPGWLDLGFAVPLLNTTRARSELGWKPETDALSVLDETVTGMRTAAADSTPVLRPRTVAGQLVRMVRSGPVSERSRP